MVDEDCSLIFQPPVTNEGSQLTLVLLLTLVANVPQTFSQVLNTQQINSIF